MPLTIVDATTTIDPDVHVIHLYQNENKFATIVIREDRESPHVVNVRTITQHHYLVDTTEPSVLTTINTLVTRDGTAPNELVLGRTAVSGEHRSPSAKGALS